MGHYIDPDQARRLVVGTPRTIWNDLSSRGLYAGQHISFDALAPLTLPKCTKSIREDGVHVGGLRYLSEGLISSGILEQARGGEIIAEVYGVNMCAKHVWIRLGNRLERLIAVPVRINAMDISHSMTIKESFQYLQLLLDSRRIAEADQRALNLAIEIEAQKDREIAEHALSKIPKRGSMSSSQTIEQHRKVLIRK